MIISLRDLRLFGGYVYSGVIEPLHFLAASFLSSALYDVYQVFF